MGNIIDYVRDFGNRKIEEYPFSDVDALVLCQFFYMQFEKVNLGLEEKMCSIQEVIGHLDKLVEGFRNPEKNIELAKLMAESERFKNLKIGNFKNVYRKKFDTSFQAMCFQLEAGITNIIYRGTDNTMTGWKEDAQLVYKKEIMAQSIGFGYAIQSMIKFGGKFRIIGHSKGGNLATFVGSLLSEESQYIIEVIDLDGPGSLTELDLSHLKGKYKKICPHEAIIGLLVETHFDRITIVSASGYYLLQHDPYCWDINENGEFIYMDDVGENAKFIYRLVSGWTSITPGKSLQRFINLIFGLFERVEVDNITKINASSLYLAGKEYFRLPAMERKVVRKIVKDLNSSYIHAWEKYFKSLKEKVKTV
ncbi:MAG: DUF2974 domain-containing protein [Firmicutes bacterium]|nr:DUF2974 domain-containing protein [Bacillota bacterium]